MTKLSYVKGSLIIICGLILSSCKVLSDYQLPSQLVGKIRSTDVYVFVPQEEISTQIEDSNLIKYGAGAITFAVLAIADSVVKKNRTTKAEAYAQPLKDVLMDVDFADVFLTKLENEIAKNSWLNIKNVHLVPNTGAQTKEQTKEQLYHQSDSDAVLFLTTTYHFGKNFGFLSAEAMSELFPKNKLLRDFSENPHSSVGKRDLLHSDNHLYRDTVSVQVGIPGADQEEDYNAGFLANNKTLLKEKFIELASISAIQTNARISQSQGVITGGVQHR